MKRIIEGKMYNTDTATCIGSYEYSTPSNFHYLCEGLYRKKNGEFFLSGEGGPLSKYREQTDTNRWSSGEAITPLSIEQAKEWGEAHLDVEDYIAVFGEPDE